MLLPWRRSLSQLSTTSRVSEPLRILYFGSDKFSCASLGALHELSQQHPEIVDSIDVVCRPPKLFGRGRKTLAVSIHSIHNSMSNFPHAGNLFVYVNISAN